MVSLHGLKVCHLGDGKNVLPPDGLMFCIGKIGHREYAGICGLDKGYETYHLY